MPGAHLAVLCVLLLALRNACGSPLPDWNHCRESSRNLNDIVNSMIAQMQDVKVKVIMMDGVPYIESADRCDPAGLRSNSKLCLSKISAILQTYIGLFEKMGGSCDWDNSDLKEEMLYLQKHLKARGINESGKKMGAVQAWMCHSLPQALLQRLTSFSSIVARVFAPGDPAKHTEDDNSFLGCGLQ